MISKLHSATSDVAAAGEKAGGAQAILMNLVPFILIFVVFYFLLIRPQKKKQAELKSMINSLKSGNTVLLNSGIKATVRKIKEDGYVVVEISANTEVEVLKSSIANVIK